MKLSRLIPLGMVLLAVLGGSQGAWAQAGIPAFSMETLPDGTEEYSVTIQVLALMTALTFIPAFLMLATSFTRIIIVFAILRQAIGLQQTPSNQILIGIALFLTFFVMAPVFDRINETALQPYLNEEVGSLEALQQTSLPMRDFMLAQTREDRKSTRLNSSHV